MDCQGRGTHVFSISYGNRLFHMNYKDCHNIVTQFYNLSPGELSPAVYRLIERAENADAFEIDFKWRARKRLGEDVVALEGMIESANRA